MSNEPLRRVGPRSALALALAAIACSSADHGDPPNVSGTQFSLGVPLTGTTSSAWLLVADDAEESRPLREATVLALTAEHLNGEGVAARDPAVWEPVDLSVIVVRPSSSDGRYVTPVDDPELRWLSDDSQDPIGQDRFTAALERWLVPSETAPASAPPILEAFAAAQSLIEGAQAPASAGEQAVVDSAAQAALGVTLVHSAREDASALAPESYSIAIDETRRQLHVVVPPLEPDAGVPCGPERAATPRFAAWLEAQAGEASAQTWPCTGFEAVPPLVDSTEPECISRGPEIDQNGSAACLLSVAIDPDTDCPNERGWFDPMNGKGERVARLITVQGEQRRLCEIVQLEGTELDACRTEWSWQPATPGWCWTDLTEWNQGCPDGRTEVALRLVGGANLGPPGTAELTCIGESFGE